MSDLRIALTFDAEHPSRPGWRPDAAASILSSLAELGVLATFFVQGRWATAYPELAQQITRGGHLIGSHSHWHAPMTLLSDHGLAIDIEHAEESIRRITGRDPRPWFRCPFGESDGRVLDALASCGYRSIRWDVAASDWEENRSAAAIEKHVVDQVLAHGDGTIVLFHSWPAATAEALPSIIRRLRTAAARFVNVEEVAPVI